MVEKIISISKRKDLPTIWLQVKSANICKTTKGLVSLYKLLFICSLVLGDWWSVCRKKNISDFVLTKVYIELSFFWTKIETYTKESNICQVSFLSKGTSPLVTKQQLVWLVVSLILITWKWLFQNENHSFTFPGFTATYQRS